MAVAAGLNSGERALVRSALRGFVRGERPLSVTTPVRWERLAHILRLNGLDAVFLASVQCSDIPDRHLEQWRLQAVYSYGRSGLSTRVTALLFSLLDGAEIPCLVTRGIALANLVYDDASLRPMADVDLLIDRRDSSRVIDAMARRGYTAKKVSPNQIVYEIEGCKFEIHWNLIKRVMPLAFGPWLEKRKRFATKEGDIYVLPPEEELIAAISHSFLHHEIDTLLRVLDIALICKRCDLDWIYIATWCEKNSMTRIFCFTLAFIDFLLDTNLREKLPVTEPVDMPENRAFDAFTKRLFGPDTRKDLFRRRRRFMSLVPGLRSKLWIVLLFFRRGELIRMFSRGFEGRPGF